MPNFNPSSMIDFEVDYYGILGIKKEDIPRATDADSKRLLRTLLHTAYREKLFEAHPDRGGDPKIFKLVVQAHTILGDPILREIYERGEKSLSDIDLGMKIDWSKLGRFRKGSLADQEGTTLFLMIIEEANVKGLEPRFAPSDSEYDNYSWEFSVPGVEKHIVLSIVEDADEVLRLTDGESIGETVMPFKIYIYIPSIKMVFVRHADRIVTDSDGVQGLIRGGFSRAEFRDLDFLSTTDHDEARRFIREEMADALSKFVNGTYQEPVRKKKTGSQINTVEIVNPIDRHRVEQNRLQEMVDLAKLKAKEETDSEHKFLKPGSHLKKGEKDV